MVRSRLVAPRERLALLTLAALAWAPAGCGGAGGSRRARLPSGAECPARASAVTLSLGVGARLEACQREGGDVEALRWGDVDGPARLTVTAECDGATHTLVIERSFRSGSAAGEESATLDGALGYRVAWKDRRPTVVEPPRRADAQHDAASRGDDDDDETGPTATTRRCSAGSCDTGWGVREGSDGGVCEGLFVCGKLAGFAHCRRGRSSYRGGMLDGAREGPGVASADDGGEYAGTHHAGKRHGVGELRDPNDTRVSGRWLDGELDGLATVRSPNGAELSVTFKKGKEQGDAELRHRGRTHRLRFRDGRVVSHAPMDAPRVRPRAIGTPRPDDRGRTFVIAALMAYPRERYLHFWHTTVPSKYGERHVAGALRFKDLPEFKGARVVPAPHGVAAAEQAFVREIAEHFNVLTMIAPRIRSHGAVALDPAGVALQCKDSCRSTLASALEMR